MRSFPSRIAGACLLDVTTFEEIEADTTATAQAVMVVVLTGLDTSDMWSGWLGVL